MMILSYSIVYIKRYRYCCISLVLLHVDIPSARQSCDLAMQSFCKQSLVSLIVSTFISSCHVTQLVVSRIERLQPCIDSRLFATQISLSQQSKGSRGAIFVWTVWLHFGYNVAYSSYNTTWPTVMLVVNRTAGGLCVKLCVGVASRGI